MIFFFHIFVCCAFLISRGIMFESFLYSLSWFWHILCPKISSASGRNSLKSILKIVFSQVPPNQTVQGGQQEPGYGGLRWEVVDGSSYFPQEDPLSCQNSDLETGVFPALFRSLARICLFNAKVDVWFVCKKHTETNEGPWGGGNGIVHESWLTTRFILLAFSATCSCPV